MTHDVATIQDWIDKITENPKGLTKWEENFIDDIADQFVMKKWISDRQEEILERIYVEKT